MSERVTITLQPLGRRIRVKRGTALQDVLFKHGLEFPCGGKGVCKSCRVRVLAGELAVGGEEREILGEELVEAGWRLGCRARAEADVTLEMAQFEPSILVDETPLDVEPREGLGVAVDLGTTTLVAQLIDLSNGVVLGVKTGLNSQARHGGDVMSRVQYAVHEKGQKKLETLIRRQIGTLIKKLLSEGDFGLGANPRSAVSDTKAKNPQSEIQNPKLAEVTIAGNTVMHHLFCGVDLDPLAHYPFDVKDDGLKCFAASELGWELPGDPLVRFLPCLGGFVGSDILAGILATRMHEDERLNMLLDLGTNGEMVIGNRERMLCASTAAGPAFEGAKISKGMRASTGAIWRVWPGEGSGLRCDVIGNVEPRGICGSGLVDAVAVSLEQGLIRPNGRFASGEQSMMLAEPVKLIQWDVRELQLAKGAIAAGLRILLNRFGATAEDLGRLYLCGAFGNYINPASARRIGLIHVPLEKVKPSGNTSLLGSKMALVGPAGRGEVLEEIRGRVTHIPLNMDAQFREIYVEEMSFPAA